MKIAILLDNTAKEGFKFVHGFSAVVEADKKVLFDVGPNALFLENAKKMSISINAIDTVVLSHGHWDHGDGLKHISGKRLITHPDAFIKRFRERDHSIVGLEMKKDEIISHFQLQESKVPFWISNEMVFLGEIPRRNDFESQKTTFLLEDGKPDFVPDDSAIAIKSEKGLIVLSGCAHAGICNTVSYAKEVCSENKVYAVLGGFHLKEINQVFEKTVEYLKNEKIELLGATHCTSSEVQEEFEKYFKILNLQTGVEAEL